MSAARLRELLAAPGCVVAAGCYDALSARVAEAAGFPAVYVSGYALEVSQLGAPDLGLLSMTEVLAAAGRVVEAVSVPVICDIDTGFGATNNLMRTVELFERSGIAGVQLEDQVSPKRWPGLARKVLPIEESVGRIEAACAARASAEFTIIARTDADEISGTEVVNRCNRYLAAGADLAMPIMTMADGERFAELHPDAQLEWHRRLASRIDGPLLGLGAYIPPGYQLQDLVEVGYSMIALATLSLTVSANAMMAALREARTDGLAAGYVVESRREFSTGLDLMRFVGLERYLKTEQRFSAPGAQP